MTAKLDFFTFPPAKVAPDDVVVVAPGQRWTDGLEKAREIASTGRSVRLVADGASLRLSQEPGSSGVAGVELGAFLSDGMAASTRSARVGVRAAVDACFDGVIEGETGASLFYANACSRLFQGWLYAYPVCREMVRAFPRATFHVIGAQWPGVSILEQMTVSVHCAGKQSSPISRLRWRRLLPLAVAGAVAASAVKLGRAHRKANAAMTQPGRPRAQSTSPGVWLGLIPDWARINWHVLHSVGEPLRAVGESVGILIVGNLNAGVRSEQDMSSQGEGWWSGIAAHGWNIDQHQTAQAVFPSSRRMFAQTLAEAMVAAGRAAQKAARGLTFKVDGTTFDPELDLAGLLKLLSVDVLRAKLAWAAADEATQRHQFSGTKVVMAANGPPELAAVDLRLQRAGAKTLHLFHGGLGDDWVGAAEHPSTEHIAWTQNDLRCMAELRQGVRVAGMPLRIRPASRRALPQSLLLMTSYLHRDYAGLRDYSAFEDEMLRLTVLLAQHPKTKDLRLVWRPHPASIEREVDSRFQKLEPLGIALSRGQTLDADISETDVVVTNMSTVFAESLFSEVPVFLHVMPVHWGAPGSDFIDPRRRFFRAEEGLASIVALLEERAAGHIDMGPETYARQQLWGPTGAPEPLVL